MKAKMEADSVRSRTEADFVRMRMQLETLQRQGGDQQQHIHVLRDSVHLKERQAAMMQSDVRFFGRFCVFCHIIFYKNVMIIIFT